MKLVGIDTMEDWGYYSTAGGRRLSLDGGAVDALVIGSRSEIASCYVVSSNLPGEFYRLSVGRPLVADLRGDVRVVPRVAIRPSTIDGAWANASRLLAGLEIEQYRYPARFDPVSGLAIPFSGHPLPTKRAPSRYASTFSLSGVAAIAHQATVCVDGREQVNIMLENTGIEAVDVAIVGVFPRTGDGDERDPTFQGAGDDDIAQIQIYPTDGTEDTIAVSAGGAFEVELPLSIYDSRPGWISIYAHGAAGVAGSYLSALVEAWD